MTDKEKKEIIGMLGDILIFDLALKRSIIGKLDGLKEKELAGLQAILREALALQKDVLAQKAKQDRTFLRRFLSAQKAAGASLLNLKKEKAAAGDKKKMDIILSKLHSL